MLKTISNNLFVEESFIKGVYERHPEANIYLVGGMVRDHFLGVESNDYDLVIENVILSDLKDTLDRLGGKLDLVGMSSLVLKYKTSLRHYDITIPRTDRNTGVGHQGFEFTPVKTIKEDLQRRDFTVNAMAYNIKTHELVDPYGGKSDIENNVLNPTYGLSFIEDPLRILRALRFSSNLGFRISKSTISLIKSALPMLNEIAIERLILEIEKVKDGTRLLEFVNLCLIYQIIPNIRGLEPGSSDVVGINIDVMASEFPVEIKGPEVLLFLLTQIQQVSLYDAFGSNVPKKYSRKVELIRAFSHLEHLKLEGYLRDNSDVTLLSQALTMLESYPDFRKEWKGQLPLHRAVLLSELAISGHDLINKGFEGVDIGEALMNIRVAIFMGYIRNTKESIIGYLNLLSSDLTTI